MRESNTSSLADRLALAFFVLSLCFFSALAGMALWATQTFPYQIVRDGVTTLQALYSDYAAAENREGALSPHARHNLNPIRFPESGTKIHDRERVAEGVTLLTSFWEDTGWRPGIRLVDLEGNVLHHWNVSPRRIWPLKDFPLGTYVHGSYLFPNGDVVFNVEYAGLVRMDSCGNIIWKSDFVSHHSVFRGEDGNFWVPGYRLNEEGGARADLFPPIKPPFGENLLVQVSPEGEVLREISLLEAIYNSSWKHLLWHYGLFREERKLDPLHLNDVEVLSSELADDYPTLDAGDIVVSPRELNAIAILNADGQVKWLFAGVFTQQHDPDFEPGGWIGVFDNRYDLTPKKGAFLGGSRITSVNPATNETKQIYNSRIGDDTFYTLAAGKHQLLQNGNRLLTEAKAGRILEVTPEGEIVWEWIAPPYDEESVFEVLQGMRYATITPKMIASWPCHGNTP